MVDDRPWKRLNSLQAPYWVKALEWVGVSITMKLQATHFWMDFFGETTILYRCFGDFPTIFQVAGDSSKTLLRDAPVS